MPVTELHRIAHVTFDSFTAALRSGQYRQLQDGRMYAEDGRVCALMVWHILNGDNRLNTPIGGANIFGMPTFVANWVQRKNDAGWTFEEIADRLDLLDTSYKW